MNKFHADIIANLLAEAGYENEFIMRVAQAAGKKSLKTNPDTQLLEDVSGLVFLEHYLPNFASRHSEYAESKWIDIMDKIWRKMSPQAHQFVLDRYIKLLDSFAMLIRKTVIK